MFISRCMMILSVEFIDKLPTTRSIVTSGRGGTFSVIFLKPIGKRQKSAREKKQHFPGLLRLLIFLECVRALIFSIEWKQDFWWDDAQQQPAATTPSSLSSCIRTCPLQNFGTYIKLFRGLCLNFPPPSVLGSAVLILVLQSRMVTYWPSKTLFAQSREMWRLLCCSCDGERYKIV